MLESEPSPSLPLGTLASVIGINIAIAAFIGVFLLVAAMNARSILVDRSLEITTSAALILNYLLGVFVGLGHIFTPVAGAIVMTMLLAWKTELSRFAGGLQPAEIRSAVLLGLIGFAIYPVLPNRYIDRGNCSIPATHGLASLPLQESDL
jgi:uncharacterized membrane protein (DUF4010 family)